MKKSKFTEAQIVFAIKQSETGVSVSEICRKMGVSEATFYNWSVPWTFDNIQKMLNERWGMAPRSRLTGAGFKPLYASLGKSQGRERYKKRQF